MPHHAFPTPERCTSSVRGEKPSPFVQRRREACSSPGSKVHITQLSELELVFLISVLEPSDTALRYLK